MRGGGLMARGEGFGEGASRHGFNHACCCTTSGRLLGGPVTFWMGPQQRNLKQQISSLVKAGWPAVMNPKQAAASRIQNTSVSCEGVATAVVWLVGELLRTPAVL